MKLDCFQQVLLEQVLADYEDLPEEAPSAPPQQAAAIFRRARRRWQPVSTGVRVAGWASILLIPALVLGLWSLRDRHGPPPVTEPTHQTTAPTEPTVTEPTIPETETVTVHLLTESRSYEADGTLKQTHTYTYDDRGLLRSYQFDAHDDDAFDLLADYTYDDHGRLLTSHRRHPSVTGTPQNYLYLYDESGTLTGASILGRRYAFDYDREGRIERASFVTSPEKKTTALIFEYEEDRLRNIYDLRVGSTPVIYSYTYDDRGLPTDLPRWSPTLPGDAVDTMLVREWPDIGTFELTYTDGVRSRIRHLTDSPELEILFELDGAGNTTRITRPSGAYTEYEFLALTLDAEWAKKLPHRDFFNEETSLEYDPPGDVLWLILP